MKTLFLLARTLVIAALATEMAAQGQAIGPGSALSFNGVNQYVAGTAQSTNLNPFPLTTMVWFKTTSLNGGLVNKYVSSTGNGWQVQVNAGHLLAWYFQNNTNAVYSANALQTAGTYNDGLWHHAALVVDTNGGSLYVDGVRQVLVGWTGRAGAATTTQPVSLGVYPGGTVTTNQYFGGQMDEISIWNVALTATQIQTYLHQSLAGTEAGLLAYWRLDDGGGTVATNAAVSTGSIYNGTLIGPPLWVQSTAPIGLPLESAAQGAISVNNSTEILTEAVNPNYQTCEATFYCMMNLYSWWSNSPWINVHGGLSLPGTNAWVDMHAAVIPTSGDFTVECWAQCPTTTSANCEILSQGSSGNAFYIGTAGGNIRAGDYWYNTGVPFPFGGWHHFAVVKSLTNTTLYVDGTNRLSLGAAIGNPGISSAFRLGRTYTTYSEYWPGQIDEVRVWGAALDGATIQNWMWQGVTSNHPYYAYLAGYYPMNDGSGTNVVDLSRNGNTGTLISNVTWAAGQSLSNEVMEFEFPGLGSGVQYTYVMMATNLAGQSVTYGGGFFQTSNNIFGYVTSDRMGVQNAQVTGSAGFSGYTDANGYFCGPGGTQLLTITKSNVVFTPTNQTAIPGVAANFSVVSGTILGHISGMAGGASNVLVIGVPLGTTQTNRTQSDVNGNYTLASEAVNCDIPVVVQPTKAGYYYTPGTALVYPGVDANFVAGSTPPSFSGPPGNVGVYQGTLAVTNPFVVTEGTSTNVTVSVSGSSNPALVPFTPTSFQIVTNYGTNITGQVVVYLTPGAVGQTTISLTANDGINPAVVTNFTVTVQAANQVPVAGMPWAVQFDGSNNEVVVANFANAPTNEMTVEFWQYTSGQNLTTPSTTFVLSSPGGAGQPTNYIMASVPYPGGGYGSIYWSVGDTNVRANTLTYALNHSLAGQWNHFAFVSSVSSNVMQIYINGVLAASQTGPPAFTPALSTLVIGPPPFAGALSEFRIWNVARTGTQILQNMNNPLPPNTPGMVAYYRFNDYESAVLADSSASSQPAGDAGCYPYLTWMAAPTNFEYYVIPSYSSNNPMYLPGYVENDTMPSSLVWSLAASNNLNGSLAQVAGGEWLYTPSPTLPGGDASFIYQVTGPGGLSSTAQVFIHVASLYPPILSPIGNQLTQVNIPVAPILFTVTDTNMAVSGITLQATADNGNLVSSAGSIFTVLTNQGDTNETVQLVITPEGGAIGSANITVTASDGHNEVTESFILQVNAQPAYTIIDLGVLPGRYASFGTGINNQGQVVGYCTLNNTNQNASEAFYYTGFGASQQIIGLETNTSLASAAYAINDNGLITGTAQVSGGSRQVFQYDSFGSAIPICFGALGTNSSGSSSTGYGINASGTMVGSSSTQTSGKTDAFISGVTLTDLGLPGMSVATGINNAGQIAGYIVTNGVTNAFVLTPVATNGVAASTNYLGFLCGGTNSMANGINQIGDVVGASVLSNGFPHAWLKTSSGGVVDLGTPANMYGATANGLNNFDQVVGTATAGGGVTHAFLYSTGRMNDLNDLIPYEETNNWTLIDARGLNDQGAIVGTGIIGGQTHAFLALPAWVIGQPIARPLGTVAQAPATTMISGPATAATAFFWNVNDQQLYAVVPCTAEIQWPTSFLNPANPTNTTPPIVTVSKSVWPRQAQMHVAGAPVQAVPQGMPAGTTFNFSTPFILYATSTSAAVDQRNVFNCQTNGYSVLRYISVVPGLPLDPINSASVFQVVRSVAWNDPNYLSNNVPAVIGTAIMNATHFDYAGRNGYVYFQKSVYDGVATDANRAYDLPTRTGPIIPVNTINSALTVPDEPLVVIWYHTNTLGVAWADTPYEYVPQWPAMMDPSNIIVIASQVGSGTLPASYLEPQIYTQNDATQAGFNPNEEHALLESGVVYALRSDLNGYYGNLSLPYVLLKYQDANNSNQWAMRVFAVVATNSTTSFTYPGTAGTEIQPPAPLNLLQLCAASNTWTAGPGYRAQVDGSLWAKAAGPNGATTNIIIHYWYPLQPGFYDTNAPTGACVPWLDGGSGTPVDVTYVISWPASQYVMPVGQTLTSAANGLPDVTHLLNASIIFDSLNLSGGSTTTNLARLYDPFSARSLPVPATATWTSSMKFNNVNGLNQFADLPYFLRVRLIYDPVNNLISFQGLMADTTPGAAQVLLNNVMSLREREAIKSLDGGTGSTDFDQLIDQLYKLTRNPNMLTLNPPGVSTNNFDDALLIGLMAQTNVVYATNQATVPSTSVISIIPETFGPQAKALTTGLFGVPPPQPVPPGSANYPPEYITVVQDDPTTPGSVVQMYVIQVSGGPALGSLAVMPGDNAFDQRLTMRHTDDFGGDPGPFQFQWYYFPGDNNGVSPPLPQVDANGNIANLNGWLAYQVPDVLTETNGDGANYATLGEGGESGLLVMSDNWFISRYTGYNIDGQTNWSGWIGQPGSGGAQFVEGWVNRVLAGLNPFDSRTSDFHTSPIDTYQTMLEQAGPRYEGPIALNSDPNYINSVGLIEAYQTVLERGEELSIDGSPPVNYAPANQALLEAASKISDLYVVLGNEAYAEYSDPTIGFSTGSTFGSLASSIFAFEDQVDTVLDQELDLLRGRDDSATSVTAPPVYNRLYWNFTGGNGEVAYVQTFNITDVNGDGFINAADAQIMFPQGHGDAWGHYLTALTVYYDLLQNTNYTWLPRASAILLAGVPVQVNYEDEQKFAHAAAAKAQTGAEIVQKTYESAYVDDPSGQYQGYEDTDTNRAWGLSEWARRAGQGAYFDWVTVNALLPAVDSNTNDTGLSEVDRTTVTEIGAIPSAYTVLQNELDEADGGLNPLGLAKQSVPFDIDPTLIDQGQTHFEQVYGRAVSAMVNAVAVWNQANEFTSALRQQQDTVQQFTQNAQQQDQDYQSRLIEVFGYPYAGDIGQPGSLYPAGYTGPDLYHYMYVDMSSYNSAVTEPTNWITGYYKALPGQTGTLFLNDAPTGAGLLSNQPVSYPVGNPANLFQPPASWGTRQAPGEIQMALNTLLQDQIRYQEALANYNALVSQIQNNLNLLEAHYGLNTTNAQIENTAESTVEALDYTADGLNVVGQALTGVANAIETTQKISLASVPTVEGLADDCFAPLRGAITAVASTAKTVLNISAAVATDGAAGATALAQSVQAQADTIVAANTLGYEMQEQVTALQNQIQQEPALRLECLNQNETLAQDLGNYQAALSKGEQLLQQRCTFAQQTAAQTQSYRYQDMTFRIFENDAIQKYKAQFALAQRYVYMAAIAYDFETDLLGGTTGSGQQFLTSIIQQQSLGEMDGANPVVGVAGLADPLAQMGQDFAVLKGQLGFNNPQTETGKFSLRYGLFRQQTGASNVIPINGTFTNDWQTELKNHVVPDLWQIPEFVRYCRPFAPQSAGAQPGLVIPFGTTITYGLNFFGWPLSGGDSAYDPTLFTTKVRSVGIWFDGYDNSGLSTTPRIYLIPVGYDTMRSPTDGETVRFWRVQDQAIPVPFPLGASTEAAANYIPMNNSLSGTLNQIRQFSSFLGYTDQGANIDPSEVTTDSRLIGRSVWNTQWMLIIPGGTLLNDPNAGLQAFINSVSDIKIFFQTYSYSGD